MRQMHVQESVLVGLVLDHECVVLCQRIATPISKALRHLPTKLAGWLRAKKCTSNRKQKILKYTIKYWPKTYFVQDEPIIVHAVGCMSWHPQVAVI